MNSGAPRLSHSRYLRATLADPAGLLEGEGRFMRHVKVRPGEGRDDEALRALMRAAYSDLKERLAVAAEVSGT